MKLRMLRGQLVIEMKLFLRDRQAVFWTFFFPVMLILLFGFAFGRGGALKTSIALIDEARSPKSAQILQKLSASSFLKVKQDSLASALVNLKNNEIPVVVFIPAGFSGTSAGNPAVEIIYNQTRPDLRYVMHGILDEILSDISETGRTGPVIIAKSVSPGQRKIRYIDFLLPGVISMTVVSTGLFAIGMVVVAYREKGKLRRLSVTPLPKPVFIAGQMFNRYFIVLAQSFVLIALAMWLFDVQMVGNVIDFIAALTVGMLAFIAIGFLVASVAKTTETASGITNAVFLPMIFLSGVYFELDNVPGFLKPLIEFLPLTHLVRAIRSIFNHGMMFSDVLPQMAILGVWIVICFGASVKLFKWE